MSHPSQSTRETLFGAASARVHSNPLPPLPLLFAACASRIMVLPPTGLRNRFALEAVRELWRGRGGGGLSPRTGDIIIENGLEDLCFTPYMFEHLTGKIFFFDLMLVCRSLFWATSTFCFTLLSGTSKRERTISCPPLQRRVSSRVDLFVLLRFCSCLRNEKQPLVCTRGLVNEFR